MTTHGDQIFQFGGVPVGLGGPPGFGFFGDHYFVDYRNGVDSISDGYGRSSSKPFKKLSYAISQMTSNNNDVCWIDGDSAVAETAMVTLTKNRCHFVGVNGVLPAFGRGAGARITMGVTTDTSDVYLFKNTGVRNTFTGIKFDCGNTLAQCLYNVGEGGEYTRYNNCEFYKSDKLTTNSTANVVCNGDTSEFVNCCFGDTVNSRGSATAFRPNVLLSRETITGKVARDCVFLNCLFNHKAAHANANFFYGSGTTDVERSLTIVNGIFTNAILAAGTIADAITFGGAQTQGNVLLMNPVAVGAITAFAEASQNVFVQGPVPTAATTGISVEVAA